MAIHKKPADGQEQAKLARDSAQPLATELTSCRVRMSDHEESIADKLRRVKEGSGQRLDTMIEERYNQYDIIWFSI